MDETGAPAPATKTRLWRRHPVGFVAATLVGLVLALLIAAAAGAWWALRSERGSAWLLAALPGVQVEAPQGRLLGDFAARRVTIHLPGSADTVTLTGLAWRGLRVQRAAAPQWASVTLDALAAERVDLQLGPSKNTGPMQAPADLALPIALDLRALRIGELHANALGAQPIRELVAQLQLGANQGAEHRIGAFSLGWDRLQISGAAQIASAAPMALAAQVALRQQAEGALPGWSANAALTGPLAAPVLQATLRAAPSPQHPAQALDARATLRPFAA
ncbi:MAG TPA: hypothetical protein VFA35_02860, partial [Burkholderiaceae bacterium]|nr:hypothetical protein [Burkholderiaceae bacterium]